MSHIPAELRTLWADMSPTERLAYLVHEGEPMPEAVAEQARQVYRDR